VSHACLLTSRIDNFIEFGTGQQPLGEHAISPDFQLPYCHKWRQLFYEI
jgi:hypothetical protein